MTLERLLGDTSPAFFLEQVFARQPFSMAGTATARSGRLQPAADLCNLADWSTIERSLAAPDADLMLAREGRRYDGPLPRTLDAARHFFDEGWTLLVRHAERHDERLAQLAEGLSRDFAAPVDVHLYATPAGQQGFGWHYDAEDVFIIETAGEKEYSLRKNTVNPWPLIETLPRDMKFEREQSPLMQCLLAAGDWLYIPNGWWHVARAKTHAISIAAGVLAPAALDVFDFLRRRLVDSLLWRQRLPITGEAAPLSEDERLDRHRELFAQLADDLARTFKDEAFLRSWLYSRNHTGSPES
ncbi:MAG: cupin domain-containing protein [Planctomycetes bacterium]|nr:cupin domain-containing protein [Planctomycetota bacterium]